MESTLNIQLMISRHLLIQLLITRKKQDKVNEWEKPLHGLVLLLFQRHFCLKENSTWNSKRLSNRQMRRATFAITMDSLTQKSILKVLDYEYEKTDINLKSEPSSQDHLQVMAAKFFILEYAMKVNLKMQNLMDSFTEWNKEKISFSTLREITIKAKKMVLALWNLKIECTKEISKQINFMELVRI